MASNRLRSNLSLMARPAPAFVNAISLAGGATVETLTVPGSAGGATYIAIFGYSVAGVYVRVGSGAAAWTPGDTTDGTAFSLTPSAYEVEAAQVISFQCAAAAIVTVEFYLGAQSRG